MNQVPKWNRKMRLAILVATVAVLMIACLTLFFPKPDSPEPMFEGKPLSAWLEKLRYDDMFVDATTHQKLPAFRKDEEAIRAIGTNSIPFLLDALQMRDNQISRLASRWSHKLGERYHIKPVEARHEEAILAFRASGEKGAPAVPVLCGMLQEGDVTRAGISMKALKGIGPPAHPSIRHATNYIFHPVLGSDVTQLIYSVGPEATEASPVLEAALKSTNTNWRVNALSALAQLKTNAAPLIPIVLQSLKSQDPGEAPNALNVVNAARHASPEVKATLLAALHNPAYTGNPRWVRMALTNLFPESHSDTNVNR